MTFKSELSTQRLAPLGTRPIDESEERAGGPQTREQWSPWLVRGSVFNSPQSNVICVTPVKWRCPLRSATSPRSVGRRSLPPVSQSARLSTAVLEASGRERPPLPPPDHGPGTGFRESLTPQMHVAVVRENRALSVTLRSAPPESWVTPASTSIDENTPVRLLPETAFI